MQRTGYTIKELLAVLATVPIFICCLLVGWPVDAIFALLAGWIFYLVRVVPQVTWNWSGFLTALVCVVALAFGLQWFLRWFYRQIQAKSGNAAPRTWSWSWTLRVLGLVVLMFVAGISAIGITHQTAWLVTSPGPLIEGGIREPANLAHSQNNLHQIGMALHSYRGVNTSFPQGVTFSDHGYMLHGWQTRLLPYVEEQAIYGRINFDLPWKDPANAPTMRTQVPLYLSPAFNEQQDNNGFALSHYAGNVRILGSDAGWKEKDITDGLSNTLMAGEVNSSFKPWGHPANSRDPALGINKSSDGFGGPWNSRKGASFIFADASVRFFSEDIDPAVLKALSTPNGGESVKPEGLE